MPLQTYILMAVTWFKNIKEKNMALTEAIEYDSITVKEVADLAWTDSVKNEFKTFVENTK